MSRQWMCGCVVGGSLLPRGKRADRWGGRWAVGGICIAHAVFHAATGHQEWSAFGRRISPAGRVHGLARGT
jgi:hypothetical protein